jgi:hypothetical protein
MIKAGGDYNKQRDVKSYYISMKGYINLDAVTAVNRNTWLHEEL